MCSRAMHTNLHLYACRTYLYETIENLHATIFAMACLVLFCFFFSLYFYREFWLIAFIDKPYRKTVDDCYTPYSQFIGKRVGIECTIIWSLQINKSIAWINMYNKYKLIDDKWDRWMNEKPKAFSIILSNCTYGNFFCCETNERK